MKNKDLKFNKFVPYAINFEYLEEKVQFFLGTSEENSKKISFSELIKFFSEKRISEPLDISFCSPFNVDCENATYTIHCENLIARQILGVILNLKNENKTIWCDWYLYDFNKCNKHPQFLHYFFLVGDGEIQLDKVTISTCWGVDYDPNVLILLEDDHIWSNEEENKKAITLWFYKKFYQETKWGKILSIRENLKLFDSEQDLIFNLLNLKTNSCCSRNDYVSFFQDFLVSINRKLEIGILILLGIIISKFFKLI